MARAFGPFNPPATRENETLASAEARWTIYMEGASHGMEWWVKADLYYSPVNACGMEGMLGTTGEYLHIGSIDTVLDNASKADGTGLGGILQGLGEDLQLGPQNFPGLVLIIGHIVVPRFHPCG